MRWVSSFACCRDIMKVWNVSAKDRMETDSAIVWRPTLSKLTDATRVG